jgi:hypothetical protein
MLRVPESKTADPGPRARTVARIEIAKAACERGLSGRAVRLFADALRQAQTIEDERAQADALKTIASAATCLPEKSCLETLQTCTRFAERIGASARRFGVLGQTAIAYAKVGHFERALEVVARMQEGSFEESGALYQVALEMLRTGLYQQGLKTARRVHSEYRRRDMFKEAAPMLAERAPGDRGARACLLVLHSAAQDDPDCLCALLPALLDVGARKAADRVLRGAIQPDPWAIDHVCRVLQQDGHRLNVERFLGACLNVLPRMSDKNKALSEAIQSIAKCVGATVPGTRGQALLDRCDRLVRRYRSGMGLVVPGAALTEVMLARVACGNYRLAVNALQHISPPSVRGVAAARLAQACEGHQLLVERRQLLCQAKMIRDGLTGRWDREKVERAIAAAEAGERFYRSDLLDIAGHHKGLAATLQRLVSLDALPPDAASIAELRANLEDFARERQAAERSGGHPSSFDWKALVRILVVDLRADEVAWELVAAASPLRARYGKRDTRWFRDVSPPVASHLIRHIVLLHPDDNGVARRAIRVACQVLDRDYLCDLMITLAVFWSDRSMLADLFPFMVSACSLDFMAVYIIVVELCIEMIRRGRVTVVKAIAAECAWLGLDALFR